MTEQLQRVVVLCVVLAVGIFIGVQFVSAPQDNDSTTQIDPPSLELDAGPEDLEPDGEDNLDEPIVVSPMPVPGNDDVPEMIACTADAKMCPDGSFVGREGPSCEFAACPSVTEPETVICTDEMKQNQICTREYVPVCGLVQVQCVTSPCDPVPETFSNGCSACSQGNVISYTAGQCEV